MAHKKLEDGRSVVDWTTGDPEGDRKYLMSAYRDFINEIKSHLKLRHPSDVEEAYNKINDSFMKWGVRTDNQVDDFPRIWIKRPE